MASRKQPSAEQVLQSAEFPPQWPFSARDFSRVDESRDSYFYSQPRVGVFHIDDQAVRALTRFYAMNVPHKADVLDLCSSWVSHLPDEFEGSLTIMGMNQDELDANARASKRVVQDLNTHPQLPFADNSFDVITNVVSVDYLTKPLEVFKEMGRVLRPGGESFMSFSNRCFPTKAIDMWFRTSDMEHVFIVGCYFHYSGAFERPRAHDLKPGLFGLSDPMYVVRAKAK
ncbi:unnamed protein product [Agarophyton chilense]